MASKVFKDGIAPSDTGVRYQLTTHGDNTTSIDNITQWEQVPSELASSDIIDGMILSCDHSKNGNVHTLTNPNSTLKNIKFVATADFQDGDTFEVNGVTCSAQGIDGGLLSGGNFVTGAVVTCFKEGNVLNFKTGGGASANYDVVGGTTQPTGKENRFWVNTSNPIPHYGLFDAAPGATTPCPWGTWADGDVAVVVAGAQFPFVAYKGNKGATVQAREAYQFDGEGWTGNSISFYQNGTWNKLGALYNHGEEFVSVTGGWTAYNPRVGLSTGTATKETDRLIVSADSNQAIAYAPANKIDLSDKMKIIFTVEEGWGSTFGHVRGYISNERTGDPMYSPLAFVNLESGRVPTNGTYELDVSAFTGVYTLSFGLSSGNGESAGFAVTNVRYV